MAWVAVDRAIKSTEEGWFSGDALRWKSLRNTIHKQICRQDFDSELNSSIQLPSGSWAIFRRRFLPSAW
jgi:hypothetical protein